MRILFVHGTGVRRERHDRLFGIICESLSERLPEAKVSSCYWGDAYGASLSAGGGSIPRVSTRGALDDYVAASPQDQETADWSLVLTDPLCELRVLAEAAKEDDGLGIPGLRARGEEVAEQLAGLLLDEPAFADALNVLLKDADLYEWFPFALRTIGESEEFTEACLAADEPAAREVATAAARAVVAGMLAAAGDGALCNGDERDRIVDLLTSRLGGTARMPGGRVAATLGRLAMRMSSQPVLDHWRGSITQKATPGIGDILRYQARGEPLRGFLKAQVTAEPGPTVVVGHSLGGVALVDVLAMSAADGEPLSDVKLLVTVGSQAPFLHELGALTGLEPGNRVLPNGFPNWLNIFDRQDLLSFLARPVFPDDPRVTDYEVSSRQPFPPCHSAYWKLDTVYKRIAEAVKAIG